MAFDFPLENSELISIAIESVLYGVYVVLFASCFQVVFKRRKGKNVAGRKLLAITSLSLFLFITWHVIIDVVRLYSAFKTINGVANSAADYYSRVNAPLSVMKTSLYVVMTLISDSFILYRTYIVWQRSLSIIAVPFCVFLADLGVGLAAAQGLSKVTPTQTLFVQRQDNLTKSFFTVTLALNTLCSSLIAARIYYKQRQTRRSFEDARAMKPVDGDCLSHVAVIIIESGAIYSTLMVILVGTYAAEEIGIFSMFLDMTSPVIGIVFSSIIVRVARGVSHGENSVQVSAFVAAEGPGFADSQLSGETATIVTLPGEDIIREMTLCEEEKTGHDSSDSLEKSTMGDIGFAVERV